MKKLMLIINPTAGKGEYVINFPEALKILYEGGYAVTPFFTSGRGDAPVLAEQYGSEYDVVACIGGDGTLSEVITGLMKLESPPPVGYFPMGTANDVATTLSLPKNDTINAAKRIVSGKPHHYDVGCMDKDKYFAYIAAFGAFTNISYATPQDQKKALGHLAYVLQGINELPKIEPVHAKIEYDDGVIEDDFVYGSMSNSTSVAGIVHFSEEMVCLGDGISELVLVKTPGTIDAFGRLVTSVLSGNFDNEKLVILHTKKAKFTFDKAVAWTRDGEDGGEYTQVELENIKRPVQLIF